ncbi:craniofacial development protein 2-like protein [Plakobranchus ocellatus]|uniref:Craniofacial development protein 2-like protein n=1 Tax=Plakobranchus ocellatus TaxID=259542 RepID=A0AAV3YQD1_9GAST|nr:craniofacial development protein 2-like protein [Plakobranchus ocellatus]
MLSQESDYLLNAAILFIMNDLDQTWVMMRPESSQTNLLWGSGSSGWGFKGCWALSDRVLLVRIAGKPVDLNIIQVYAPTANSNDEDLDKFYNELDTAKTQCKSQDPLIIMGDFNAKVGTEKVDDIVGKHGLGIRNERVQNKFEALGDAEEVEQQWENFKSAIMEAATEVIPKAKMDDRRNLKLDGGKEMC